MSFGAILLARVVTLLGLVGFPVAQHPALSERVDFSRRAEHHELGRSLREISGLAITEDGRLFAHDDERATVYELDPHTGRRLRRFHLGRPVVPGDFEGLAVEGDTFYLITSRGVLYRFREPAARDVTAFGAVDTGVGARCEVEGLAYDPVDGMLLAPCKTVPPREAPYLVIYRLTTGPRPRPASVLRVPLARLEAFGLPASFHPSGIEVDPRTRTIVLISARDRVVLELSRDLRIVDAVRLRQHRHPQMEGVAFAPDGSLLIADEGRSGRGRLTRYAPVRGGAVR